MIFYGSDCAVGYCTVNVVALMAVPPGVVTAIFAVTAPVGTVAVIFVSETTVNVATTVPNFTAVAAFKAVPLIVTSVPTGPLGGVKLEMVGVILKFCSVVRLPPGSLTVINPVVAPDRTFPVAKVSFVIVSVPAPVPKVTPVAVLNPCPSKPTDPFTFAECALRGATKGFNPTFML